MLIRKRIILVLAVMIITLPASFAQAQQVPYESHLVFTEAVTTDLIKLLPRAMGSFIYQNRLGFARGITYVNRNVMVYPLKMTDLEEIRNRAYANLMRDIPYCVEAFKGGELKLDTSPSNLSARLGMIAYWIFLQKYPAFPDTEYLRNFQLSFERLIGQNIVDIWLYYDGYGDFNSLGELMERLQKEGMPRFTHVVNDEYPVRMRGDKFAMFRAPNKHKRNMLLSNVDVRHIYNNAMNAILDTYLYIWKKSGMDLAHPSYPIPPGTIVNRPSSRRVVQGGALTRIRTRTVATSQEAQEEELPEGLSPSPAETGQETPPASPAPEAPQSRNIKGIRPIGMSKDINMFKPAVAGGGK
jgi:hypothetical protein